MDKRLPLPAIPVETAKSPEVSAHDLADNTLADKCLESIEEDKTIASVKSVIREQELLAKDRDKMLNSLLDSE